MRIDRVRCADGPDILANISSGCSKGARAADPYAPFDMELNLRSRGVLKSAVPRWLNEKEFAGMIAGTRTAHKKHGGEGAMYIYLRKGR